MARRPKLDAEFRSGIDVSANTPDPEPMQPEKDAAKFGEKGLRGVPIRSDVVVRGLHRISDDELRFLMESPMVMANAEIKSEAQRLAVERGLRRDDKAEATGDKEPDAEPQSEPTPAPAAAPDISSDEGGEPVPDSPADSAPSIEEPARADAFTARQPAEPDNPFDDSDDIGARYMGRVETRIADAAGDELLRRVEERRSKGAAPTATAAPDAPESPVAVPDPNKPFDGPLAAAKDIGKGIVEAPRQIVGGARDAVQETGELLQSVRQWMLDKGIAKPSEDGEEGPPFVLPEVDPARSATGAAVRSVSQFLTGFLTGGKLMKLAGIKPATTTAGKAAQAGVKGAFADFAAFDAHEKRLGDLWKDLGLPENELANYLAADPEDSEIEGRFKNLVEGAGLGVLAEGVFLGARTIQRARRARAAEETPVDPLEAQRQQFGEVTDRDFMILGDPNEPLFKISKREQPEALALTQRTRKVTREGMEATETGVPDDVAARSLTEASELGGDEVFINFGKIDTADDVKSVMGQMADAFAGKIDASRRGVQSNEETVKLADQMGMTVPDLLARRKGQPFNAEEAFAARQLWASSADKLLEVAKAAAAPNAGAVDQYNFRKMMAIHYAVQAEVIGARTETARALQAWSIPAGGSVEKARAIQNLLDAMGGPDASAAMAKRLAILAKDGTPADVSKFIRKGWGAASVDAIKEVWINGLLSSPKTHLVNISSNTMVAVQQIYERAAARGIASVRGAEDSVAAGEAAAMTYGMVTSLKDAFRLSFKAMRSGVGGESLGKLDLPRQNALSSRAIAIERGAKTEADIQAFADSAAGRTVDVLGEAFRVPGRLLVAEDEFFKTIGYRMELHAQSVRQATSDVLSDPKVASLPAQERSRLISQKAAEIVGNPPEHIRIASADAALYNTFTNQTGDFGKLVLRARNYESPLNPLPFILPFVRTPVNIARYAFERTPLAPLVGQWRADIAAGGARRDLALARMSTGTTVMLLAADYADSGLVSGRGPKDQGEREAMMRQGWQPYSLKVGDRWYSYNRSDPFGMTMGFAADLAELTRRGDIDPDDLDEWQEVVAGGIAAVSQVTLSKTYLSGMSEFVEMMSDPTRYSASYVNDFVGSFVPYTSLVAAVETAIDPTSSETNTPMDAVLRRLPMLSERLTPRRNLWGEPIRQESGLGRIYDFFSPVTSRAIKDSPIDAEIERLAADVRRIGKKATFDGVDVNFRDWPEVYDEYIRLSGNALKHPAWDLGARDFLDSVVSGDHPLSEVYQIKSDGKDGMKSAFIRGEIQGYRRLAQQRILDDPKFAGFAAHIEGLKSQARERRLPVLQ